MFLSAFDQYRIGLGPSSAQTDAPMRAARRFVHELEADGNLFQTQRLRVDLYGSIAYSGRDLGTDRAILAGLCGDSPEASDSESIAARAARVAAEQMLPLGGKHGVAFIPSDDFLFHVDKTFDFHRNAIRITAKNAFSQTISRRIYYSVGDGQILAEGEKPGARTTMRVPLPFQSAAELVAAGQASGKRIAEIMRINELALRSPGEVQAGLLKFAAAMRRSVDRGLSMPGVLPGGGNQLRRAAAQADAMADRGGDAAKWASVYAMAVAEENAAGGRVVAAPSCGSAGPVAGVLHQWLSTAPLAGDDGKVTFLLAAAAIGHLARAGGVKHVGCQGEVGVASAMAAAGLAAVNNASNTQVLLAAERALDRWLGTTCDPVGGLIREPCIERNSAAAAHAVEAARLALRIPDPAPVGFDRLLRSMVESGKTMTGRYKELSLGGLALSVVDC